MKFSRILFFFWGGVIPNLNLLKNITRPGVARAVLQTALWLIDLVSKWWFVKISKKTQRHIALSKRTEKVKNKLKKKFRAYVFFCGEVFLTTVTPVTSVKQTKNKNKTKNYFLSTFKRAIWHIWQTFCDSCVVFHLLLDKVVKLVGGGSVINGAYPV